MIELKVVHIYMVTTALLTVRRRYARVEWMDLASMLLGLAVGIAGLTFGLKALHSATGTMDGYPPPLYFIFGTIALLSAAGDIRMILAQGLEGRRRIARHLWRMCFSMFIATGSFFLGQAKVFPKPIRIIPLLAILALLPMLLLLYWLSRVLFTRGNVVPNTASESNPLLGSGGFDFAAKEGKRQSEPKESLSEVREIHALDGTKLQGLA